MTAVFQDAATVGKALGERASIHPDAAVRGSTFGAWCEVGSRTRIADSVFGDYSYVDRDSDIAHATVGKFCSIASAVRINPGDHPLERVMLNHLSYRSSAYGLGADDPTVFAWRASRRVFLGHDVWIGHGTTVLAGVRVGIGAAIGAGAVVRHDVPDFAIAVGVPARVVRLRFSPEVIASLLRIAWWDWSHERLGAAMADIRAGDATAFCARYDAAFARSAT